jgi:4-diphosphocytidyl-2-C-methyl-D-erythritol kinase
MPLAPVTLTGLAPAKVNLTLHVTGKRADGYHLLDSLVVFAGIGDEISATPAPEFTLDVSGQFSDGVPRDETNSILRAARMFQARAGVGMAAHLRLTKTLPHAAGIGSGSSDAATTLSLLARLWDVPPLAADDPRRSGARGRCAGLQARPPARPDGGDRRTAQPSARPA